MRDQAEGIAGAIRSWFGGKSMHCAPLRTSVVVHLDAQPLKNDRPNQARSTSCWPEADLLAVQGCCGRTAGRPLFGCYKPGAIRERRFRFGNRRGKYDE